MKFFTGDPLAYVRSPGAGGRHTLLQCTAGPSSVPTLAWSKGEPYPEGKALGDWYYKSPLARARSYRAY
jgi:hypothetical protein